MDFLDIEDAIILDRHLNNPFRFQRRLLNRVNPIEDTPNPRTFKSRYRFDRDNVMRILDLVEPIFYINRNRRGNPCSPLQIVCSALEILGGGHFFRVNGYAGGIGGTTAWTNLYR